MSGIIPVPEKRNGYTTEYAIEVIARDHATSRSLIQCGVLQKIRVGLKRRFTVLEENSLSIFWIEEEARIASRE